MLLLVNPRDDWTTLRIHADDAGQRLDRFLRKLLPECPLGQIFKFLRKGRIRMGTSKARPEERLEEGQEISFRMPLAELESLGWSPASMKGGPNPGSKWSGARIHSLFEDEDILAVDKPPGLPVHGGSGHENDDLGLRVRAALSAASSTQVSHTFTPGPAHRLDRETSGLLLFGKSARGLRALSELFRDKRIQKFYLALIRGVPAADHGRLEGRFLEVVARRRDRPKLIPDAEGAPVNLEYQVIASHAGHSLVRVHLGTGKMHQIRAQFAAEGHALAGDIRYGDADPGRGAFAELSPQRFLLHSERLVFEHPFTHESLDLRVAPPQDFQKLLARLGLRLSSEK
jgi:23S rRNA pseudouridine955/2504/2580 synthase